MILTTLRDVLKDSTAIRDRVDKGAKYPGIYADNGPQNVRGEYIVLTDVNSDHEYHLRGEIGTIRADIQFDCYSDRAEKAKSLFMLIRNRLSGYSDAVVMEATVIGGLGAVTEKPTNGSGEFVHRYSKDFSVFCIESVPTLT